MPWRAVGCRGRWVSWLSTPVGHHGVLSSSIEHEFAVVDIQTDGVPHSSYMRTHNLTTLLFALSNKLMGGGGERKQAMGLCCRSTCWCALPSSSSRDPSP